MAEYSGSDAGKPQSAPAPESVNAALAPHPLISKLLAQGDKSQSTVVLIGYVGPSEKEGFIRLYQELELGNYLEIPRTAILHGESVDSSQSVYKTKLLVNATEKLAFVQVVEASFLKGKIASKFLETQLNVAIGNVILTHHPSQGCDATQLNVAIGNVILTQHPSNACD